MFSRIPAGDTVNMEDGGEQTSHPPATGKVVQAAGKGHSAAILPRAKADREKWRQTLMRELRRQLPSMLESSGRNGDLPERSLNVIRMLTRLDQG